MLITLTKHQGKAPTLTCRRDDGSTTWQNYGKHGEFFPVHDLTHYALEKELGYAHGFFGMIAAGRDLSDFGPGDASAFHPETVYSEVLAGLLSAAEGNGSVLSYEDIKAHLDAKAEESNLPPIALSKDQLAGIRKRATDLVKEWTALRNDGAMELTF